MICEQSTNLTTVSSNVPSIFISLHEFVPLNDVNLKAIDFEFLLTYTTDLLDTNTDETWFKYVVMASTKLMPAQLSAYSIVWSNFFNISIYHLSPFRNQSTLPFRNGDAPHLMVLQHHWETSAAADFMGTSFHYKSAAKSNRRRSKLLWQML